MKKIIFIILICGSNVFASSSEPQITLEKDMVLIRNSPSDYLHFSTEVDPDGCHIHAYIGNEISEDQFTLKKGSSFPVYSVKDKDRFYDYDGTAKRYIRTSVSAKLPYFNSYLIVICKQEGFFPLFSNTPNLDEMMETFKDLVSFNF